MENLVSTLFWALSTVFVQFALCFYFYTIGKVKGIEEQKNKQKQLLNSEKFNISYDVFNSWRSKLGKPLGGVGEFYLQYLRENLEKTRDYAKK